MSGEQLWNRGSVIVSSNKPSSGISDSGVGKQRKKGRNLSHGTGASRAGTSRSQKPGGFAGAACHVRHASDWRPIVVDDRPIRILDVPGI